MSDGFAPTRHVRPEKGICRRPRQRENRPKSRGRIESASLRNYTCTWHCTFASGWRPNSRRFPASPYPSMPAETSPEERLPRHVRIAAFTLAVLCALAFAPFFAAYILNIWHWPELRFIPLLVLFVVYKAFADHRFQFSSSSSSSRGAVWLWGRILAWCAIALIGGAGLIVSCLGPSPWLAWVSGIVLVFPIFCVLRNRHDGKPALGLWALLLLTVRPPGGMADQLIVGLQRASSAAASVVLDRLGILHNLAGTIIELPEKRFLVEEACSGVQSLFTLLFIAGAIAVHYRRSVVQAACLLIAAGAWAWAMNVLRILAVVLGDHWFNVDISDGWMHAAVGYVAIVLAFLLLLSTDRLLFAATGPIPEVDEEVESGRRLNPMVVGFNRFVGGEPNPWHIRPLLQLRAARLKGRRLHPGFLAPMLLMTCMCLIADAYSLQRHLDGTAGSLMKASTALPPLDFDETTLPERFGSWQQAEFERVKRESSSQFGEHSAVWRYRTELNRVAVGQDYYFQAWHELTQCYQNTGWQLVERTARHDASEEWTPVEATFKNAQGEHAVLVFSLCDIEGQPLADPMQSPDQLARNRMGSWFNRVATEGQAAGVLQQQVFAVSGAPPNETLRRQAMDLHLATRQLLLSRSLEQLEEVGR